MKLARRILWSILTLFIAALITVWIRSYSIADGIYHCVGKGTQLHIYACQGQLVWRVVSHPSFKSQFTIYHSFEVNPVPPNPYTKDWLPANQTSLRNFLVFRYGTVGEMIAVDAGPLMHAVAFAWGTCVEVPIWPILSIALLPFACVAFRKLRHRHAAPQNLCPTCRYDLRAHKPGDNCPECGTTIPPKDSATI